MTPAAGRHLLNVGGDLFPGPGNDPLAYMGKQFARQWEDLSYVGDNLFMHLGAGTQSYMREESFKHDCSRRQGE